MSYWLNKIINNPYLYINRFTNNLINGLCFLFRVFLYKKISIDSFIALNASVRNHKSIIIGPNSVINCNVILWPTHLTIGRDCQINPGTAIYGKVKLGNSVMIAPNCMLAGGSHNFTNLSVHMRFQGSNEEGIIIQDDVWIGANSVILDGVTIGKGTIVGAGSVVTKDLNSNSIYCGNPLRLIRIRNGNS